MLAAGKTASYVTAAVNFQPGTDYMVGTTNTAFTGATDSKLGMVSFWFKMQGNDASFQSLFENDSGVEAGLGILRLNDNKWRINCITAAGGPAVQMVTTSTFTSGGGWNHLLASWDVNSGVARYQLYINDASNVSVSATADSNIGYNNASTHRIGARSGPALPLNADIEDLWICYGSSLDLSNSTNRRKFISATSKPVDLGAAGDTPGISPIGYFSGRAGVANWHVNKGTGGNLFTLTGTLSAASTNPSD
jgi:hypothetical protein